jgi:hypothetical protein
LPAVFDVVRESELNKLVEDLKQYGLLTPIVVYEDKILGGRNRDRGCFEAEVTPRYVEYTGSDPLGFIVSANLHRRHLTVGLDHENSLQSVKAEQITVVKNNA